VTRAADIGILGGGQLARMLLLAATSLGLDVAVMEHVVDSPAGRLTRHEIIGGWDDDEALRRLAAAAPTIMLENEFVPAEALRGLQGYGARVVPGPDALSIVQDKQTQKERLAAVGLPLPPFRAVEGEQDVLDAAMTWGWPLVLKRRRNGYDGYGNRTLRGPDDVLPAIEALHGSRDRPEAEHRLMVEAFVPFEHELAVMVARGRDETVVYPVVETVQKNHICHQVLAPAALSDKVRAEARGVARAAVEAVGLQGMVGVELFLAADDTIMINEMAPRVHNSGHYTIEGCVTSQFENALRAALGWPLGDPSLLAPAAVMVNILGATPEQKTTVEKGQTSKGQTDDLWTDGLRPALAVPGAHLHLYGKREARPGRKMGHVTALGATLDEARATATSAAATVIL